MKGNIYWRFGKPIVRFKGVYKTCQSLQEAERVLTGLRFKEDEGTFDVRDYQKDQPLGFENLGKHWVDIRRDDVRCIRNLNYHIRLASAFFGNRNVKEIGYAELEDFLRSLPAKLSAKSKKNIFTTLHTFWGWVHKRYKFPIPEFPQIKFELNWRNTVDKETQARIIEEVKRISYHINPKIWIGIKWLATYISIRPIELINIKEGDFDLSLGVVNVRYNKENKSKIVPLLDEDIELAKSFPQALPSVYFFRHGRRKGVARRHRHRFGKDYLYSWWRIACKNCGVDGVDLYGGTRHSSVRALRERFTPDQIKKATMHHTNAAFERYYQIELEDTRKVYRGTTQKGEVVEMRKAK